MSEGFFYFSQSHQAATKQGWATTNWLFWPVFPVSYNAREPTGEGVTRFAFCGTFCLTIFLKFVNSIPLLWLWPYLLKTKALLPFLLPKSIRFFFSRVFSINSFCVVLRHAIAGGLLKTPGFAVTGRRTPVETKPLNNDMAEEIIVELNISELMKALKPVQKSKANDVHIFYEKDRDVMHVHLSPLPAETMKPDKDGVLYRYAEGGLVGFTISNFSKWNQENATKEKARWTR